MDNTSVEARREVDMSLRRFTGQHRVLKICKCIRNLVTVLTDRLMVRAASVGSVRCP